MNVYARHDEIRAYMRDCAERYGVLEHVRFGADVREAVWDEEAQRWQLTLGDGALLTARVVIGGLGGLTQPAFPDIPGLQDFAGVLMHSAAWDHAVDLDGARVGVIGTGASAIQLVPEVAKRAARVDVFQRTPAWVFPKLDRRFTRAEKALFRHVPITQRALRAAVFAFSESIAYGIVKNPRALWLLEAVGRAHLRLRVRDRELRRKLMPSYRAGCKRMLIANDFYPALTRPNVELLTDGIERITPEGVRTADGALRELDVLVCATGFDLQQAVSRVAVTGRAGRTLADTWAAGFEAHRGTMVAGFPNLMFLSGPNTGTGSTSQVFMIEAQIHYVLEALRTMSERGAGVVEVTPEAHAAYNDWIAERMQQTVWLTGGCNSWYLDANGRNTTLYPGYSSAFRRSLRRFRTEEHQLAPAHAPAPVPVAA
jgi:cation diffusion facilitator CzcD-associated flavoprotein CzcO